MAVMIMNQSHNQVRYHNHNYKVNNNYDSDNSQVRMNNGGYVGGCGAYATWHPAVNNSSFLMNNNNQNWKMNKRNVNNINYVNDKSNKVQQLNRLKPRRVMKKKYSKSSAPLAPRNTTSFLIRAKKSGLASLVSPCAVTPAVLPTPVFSPSSDALVDTAKEEWGVDGYGSMNGLIRLRNDNDDDDDEADGVIDFERFEMVYPSNDGERNSLETRVDDQVSHIARLEEENLLLKERLFYMEREFGELRTRLESLEVKKQNDYGRIDNDNSDGNQCSVHIVGRNMDNNDENECCVHNDDHKMEDDDNARVGAKDRKLNELLVNIPSGHNMDNNDENECSVHNKSHKMEGDEDHNESH